MKTITILTALIATSLLSAEQSSINPDDLHTTEGTDFTVEELIKSGAIVPGQRMGKGPVLGSKIVVNQERLEQITGKLGPIDTKHIGGIQHQSGHGTRKDFAKWSRWYQEHDNTQIFRLIKGDQNFRSGIGEDTTPGRIEAYSKSLVVAPGTWREWEGTYTIIKPHGACIFQLFHSGGQLWAFHLGMNNEGDITFKRRRPAPGLEKNIVLGENMVGIPLSIKIRSNGFDFEIYKKRPLEDKDWIPVTTGSYQKAEDNKIQFRWGMYLGQEKGASVHKDAMHFVSGVTIR